DPLHAQPVGQDPRHAQPMAASLVRTIFAQQRPQDAWAQLHRVTDQLRAIKFGAAADLLEEAAPDVLAYTAFPAEVWKKIWSNNPRAAEQRNPPPHRRGRHLPNRPAVTRLVGAVLAEQHDEWAIARRYMSQEALRACQQPAIDTPPHEQGGTPAQLLPVTG
ncbi:MAG: transposase, partial [Egibacteraceae bacterium]